MSFQQTDIPAQRSRYLAMLHQQMISYDSLRTVLKIVYLPTVAAIFISFIFISFSRIVNQQQIVLEGNFLFLGTIICLIYTALFLHTDINLFYNYVLSEMKYRDGLKEGFDMEPNFEEPLKSYGLLNNKYRVYFKSYDNQFSIFNSLLLVFFILCVTVFISSRL